MGPDKSPPFLCVSEIDLIAPAQPPKMITRLMRHQELQHDFPGALVQRSINITQACLGSLQRSKSASRRAPE